MRALAIKLLPSDVSASTSARCAFVRRAKASYVRALLFASHRFGIDEIMPPVWTRSGCGRAGASADRDGRVATARDGGMISYLSSRKLIASLRFNLLDVARQPTDFAIVTGDLVELFVS